MTHTERFVSMGFTDEQFPAGTHMCYIYKDDQERKEFIAKYLSLGLQGHEKVNYFVDVISPEEMRAQFNELGLNLPLEMDERDFSISRALEIYCTGSKFVPENTLQKLRSMYALSIDEGYSGTRISGEMSWVLREGVEGTDRLMEYESLVNTVLLDYPLTAICQYDARRFNGSTLFDVLNVHPMMIIRGQVVRNPYYVIPEKFLANYVAPRFWS